ncbi:MAG: M48 family metallopeptidase [Cyanobacteria bacterium P01_D01_bin.44]
MKTLRKNPCYLHRWLYAAGALMIGFSTVWAIPPAKADLFDLIFQGLRIIQISNLSEQQEIELGQQINEQLLEDVRVYENPAITHYVDGIGQQLVPGVNRSQIPYTFQIIEADGINAFATLGGFVYLNTGLLKAADNEAQLASVIAHEVGHVDRRHAIQQLQQAAIAEGILTAGGLNQNAAIAIGVELALHRPNSRAHELEADQAGLDLLTQAGYAPIAAVDFLQKLQGQSNGTPDFLSTHPYPDDRIDALSGQLDPAAATMGKGQNRGAYRERIRDLL